MARTITRKLFITVRYPSGSFLSLFALWPAQRKGKPKAGMAFPWSRTVAAAYMAKRHVRPHAGSRWVAERARYADKLTFSFRLNYRIHAHLRLYWFGLRYCRTDSDYEHACFPYAITSQFCPLLHLNIYSLLWL